MSLLTSAATRFMGKENLQRLGANRRHEPEIPLTRPSGTLAPTGGEACDELSRVGWDEGALRFMEKSVI